MSSPTEPPLPGWLRATVILGLLATLFVNLGAGVFKDHYNGGSLSLLLVGTLGTTVGVEHLIREGRTRSKKNDENDENKPGA